LEIDLDTGNEGKNLITGVSEAMHEHQEAAFLRPWIFRHKSQDSGGEVQRDEVRDILATFLKCVVDPRRGLFEAPAGSGVGGGRFLPVPGNTDLKMYRLVGRVLFKGILDSKPVYTGFSSVLFKFLLQRPMDLADAEVRRETPQHLIHALHSPVCFLRRLTRSASLSFSLSLSSSTSGIRSIFRCSYPRTPR